MSLPETPGHNVGQDSLDTFIGQHFEPRYNNSSPSPDDSSQQGEIEDDSRNNVTLLQSAKSEPEGVHGIVDGTYPQHVITAHDFDVLNNFSFDEADRYGDSMSANFDILATSTTGQDFSNIPQYVVPDSSLVNHDYASLSVDDLSTPPRAPVNSAGGFEQWRQARQSLPRRRSRYFMQKTYFPNVASFVSDQPSITPNPAVQESVDPLQRWQNSSLDVEPASAVAINQALSGMQLKKSLSNPEIALSNRPQDISAYSRRQRRPRSLARSISSRGSSSSRQSEASDHYKRDDSARRSKDSVARRTANVLRRPKIDRSYRFKCTFCCDQFQRKYDWARHEKSLHLDLEEWKCTPFGGIIILPPANRFVCAYCNVLDPDAGHLDLHNHHVCHAEDVSPKIFRRKDHLAQHLRLVHHLDVLPVIEGWKTESPPLKSRCGMCSFRMHSWEERQEHLATHFRKGQSMDDWHGGHDFEPHVEARIRNAMPPYLIGNESRSFVPISATNMAYKDHHQQILSHLQTEVGNDQNLPEWLSDAHRQITAQADTTEEQPAFTVLLATHLARYAQELAKTGIVPTDQMFQEESRKMVYYHNDPWDQTVADNAEWLAEFRQLHNLSLQLG